jgi:hypothetical protein
VIGGGDIWTEYGVYSCILGPDANSQFHELECQGLAKVTSAFPKFDLRPLHSEVYRTAPQDLKGILPDYIRGDQVKLLIGIRSSALSPVQRFTLPSGLGVFESLLPNINGSYTCFGGPHEVFTRGYTRSGTSANHLQVYFAQITNAYLRSPYVLPPGLPGALPLEAPFHSHESSEVLDNPGVLNISEACNTVCAAANTASLIALFLYASIDRLHRLALEAAHATKDIEYPFNNLSLFRMEGRFTFLTFNELESAAISSQLDVRARPRQRARSVSRHSLRRRPDP